MASVESSNLSSPKDVLRPPAQGFKPSGWGDYFITRQPMPSFELENIKQRIDELVEVIRKMIRNATDQLQSLELIDAIQHLGVAYHFELEINDTLDKIHRAGFGDSNDPYMIAMGFRLLRQQRFPISADVFSKFVDEEGNFKDSLKHDAKALLSLYEAAHLGTPSEKILENVANFARTHLKLMLSNLDPTLATMASRALETPRFRRTERLEAREYLSIYEEDKNRSEILLEFAKLDFHLVQSIHLEELRHISLWKNSMALEENLPFARERSVELYFWMVGVYFEPCYSRARIMATKIVILVSILDDIYDQYGTPEELELLTGNFERWEFEEVDRLPNYLQHLCMVLYETFQAFEDELAIEQSSFRLRFLKKEMTKLVQAYIIEMRWGKDHYIPKIEEHLCVSLWSSTHPVLFCVSLVGMHEVISEDAFDWATKFPEIVKASCIIARLLNDITSDEHEEIDGHFSTIVESYAMEHKCTKDAAREMVKVVVQDAWKTLNEEYLLTNLPLFLVRPIVNLTRVCELFYKDIDNYTNPFDSTRDNIKLVMLEPTLSEWK